MIPTRPPSGQDMRQRRLKVLDMIRDCVSRNPVPFLVFRDLKAIRDGLDLLIREADKLSQPKKD
jgi:hypothetical protein